MPLDYGVRGRKRMSRRAWTGVGLGVAAAAVAIGVALQMESTANSAVIQEWTIKGPPCPSLTKAAYTAQGFAAHERGAEFDGVSLARQVGHMSCRAVPNRGGFGLTSHPVCQFTGPAALHVNAGGGDFYFLPGYGKRATVSIAHGQVSCVLGGAFTSANDPT